jgi:hypothetical protein
LTPGGIEKLHAFRNFKAVDFNWLERELESLGEVDKYKGTLTSFRVLLVSRKDVLDLLHIYTEKKNENLFINKNKGNPVVIPR